MGNIFDMFVRFLCYGGFIFGVWLLFSPFFMPAFKNAINLSRFRRDIVSNSFDKKNNIIIEHLSMLLNVSLKNKSKNFVYTFMAISIVLFITTFLVLFNSSNSNIMTLFLSALVGLSPYIILRVRLNFLRTKGSYEADELVSELINQYKINNLNAIEAIHNTAIKSKNIPYSQKALFKLSFSVREYRNDSELDYAIKEFIYAFDTEWAVLLGMNLKIAIMDGTDIKASLDDILKEFQNVRKVVEKSKRYNHEAFSMIKYVIPGMYIFSIFFAMKVFGFSLKKFFTYQLFTDLGLKLAIATYLSFLINVIVLYLNSTPKYDI